jgi:hypothetical protein
MSSALPDPAAVLAAYLREAVAEARIAYEFVPISHTYSALQACLAAEQALAVLRDALEAGGAALRRVHGRNAISRPFAEWELGP